LNTKNNSPSLGKAAIIAGAADGFQVAQGSAITPRLRDPAACGGAIAAAWW
jgi:hypothetical protein